MTLISPFVGRIYDWYKKDRRGRRSPPTRIPGVASVTKIYNYYKKFGYKTQVMGASFRKVEQITHLAGCDLLTISPDLLEKLAKTDGDARPRGSRVEGPRRPTARRSTSTRRRSAGMHNEDPMAVEKLSEGIRKFYADARKLEKFAQSMVTQKVGG